MAALPDLITVAQFQQLPEHNDSLYELHHGEVVALTRPKSKHAKLQRRLSRILEQHLAAFGECGIEWSYCPASEFEVRVADVAVISKSRWDNIDPDDYLHGSPELVIEVKSPSNTKRHFQELAALTLASGALEFWIVDVDARTVSVVQKGGVTKLYAPGAAIPLTAFGAAELAVNEIFE